MDSLQLQTEVHTIQCMSGCPPGPWGPQQQPCSCEITLATGETQRNTIGAGNPERGSEPWWASLPGVFVTTKGMFFYQYKMYIFIYLSVYLSDAIRHYVFKILIMYGISYSILYYNWGNPCLISSIRLNLLSLLTHLFKNPNLLFCLLVQSS